jgi:hypothetical protein
LPLERNCIAREKAILPNEAKVGSTGLISNGLAGVQTDAAGSRISVMAIIVFSSFVQTHY